MRRNEKLGFRVVFKVKPLVPFVLHGWCFRKVGLGLMFVERERDVKAIKMII